MPSKKKPDPQEPLFQASPDPIATKEPFKGGVVMFDANLLGQLRKPSQASNDLGALLNAMRRPDMRPHVQVVALPAIAEANYRSKGATPQTIAGRRSDWMREHFDPYGIPELMMYQSKTHTGISPNLFELFYRVLVNYSSLHLAHAAVLKFGKAPQRVAAVDMFFDSVAQLGVCGVSRMHLVCASSALCGNQPAFRALHIRDANPSLHMNGSWDLLHWNLLITLFQKSRVTRQHPYLFTHDKKAAGLFTRVVSTPDESLVMNYDADGLDEAPKQRAMVRMTEAQEYESLDAETFIQRLIRAVQPSGQCPEFNAALRMLEQCAVDAEPNLLALPEGGLWPPCTSLESTAALARADRAGR